ncbi:BNR/Asp-box repeat protein [Anatilimnocola aggregata]|uniref:BNR/Asp-box repeat protein n=1 Tax=Anatilimnocola aggregata TaxID=2528021 RepID=A0A517Y960_9BACT|nr:sialidase family protein [Anatilimnocola aggregata]QDU26763.1 BNR/Asp-box repeat protein [Anatilimnocola aggregata]
MTYNINQAIHVVLFSSLLLITAALGEDVPNPDVALDPATVIVNPWKNHIPQTKRQGVAGIERTAKGRLWVVYGRDVESTRNYQVLKKSDDDGQSWSDFKLMVLPQKNVRAMSPAIWIDPQQRLWLFWGQSFGLQDNRFGIFAIVTDEPDAENPKWSAPRRLGDGIMLNKPTVLKNGDWLLTSSIWKADDSIRVYASTDQGATFALRGSANVPDPATRGPDEPMIVERKDGTLWMMVRMQGLAETISRDGGKTWTPVERIAIKHCTSRFFLRRLQTGALLLVKHGPLDERAGREKLMAFLSDDDGKSWQGGLLLDEREHVTYPDGVQARDGTIYVVYDHNRTPDGEVLFAVFTEEDVRAGKVVSDKVRLRTLIDRLPQTNQPANQEANR